MCWVQAEAGGGCGGHIPACKWKQAYIRNSISGVRPRAGSGRCMDGDDETFAFRVRSVGEVRDVGKMQMFLPTDPLLLSGSAG